MYSRLVARLLWCAPLSERGVVQHWGNTSWQCSVRVTVGTVAEARAWLQYSVAAATTPAFESCMQQQACCKPCMLHAACSLMPISC